MENKIVQNSKIVPMEYERKLKKISKKCTKDPKYDMQMEDEWQINDRIKMMYKRI